MTNSAPSTFQDRLRHVQQQRARKEVIVEFNKFAPWWNLSEQRYQHWEKGSNGPGEPELVWDLELFFGCPADYFTDPLVVKSRPSDYEKQYTAKRLAWARARKAELEDEIKVLQARMSDTGRDRP